MSDITVPSMSDQLHIKYGNEGAGTIFCPTVWHKRKASPPNSVQSHFITCSWEETLDLSSPGPHSKHGSAIMGQPASLGDGRRQALILRFIQTVLEELRLEARWGCPKSCYERYPGYVSQTIKYRWLKTETSTVLLGAHSKLQIMWWHGTVWNHLKSLCNTP